MYDAHTNHALFYSVDIMFSIADVGKTESFKVIFPTKEYQNLVCSAFELPSMKTGLGKARFRSCQERYIDAIFQANAR